MSFDIDSARKAGYSDDEIASYLAQSKGFDYQGAVKAGYSPTEVIAHLQPPVGPQSLEGISEMPTAQDLKDLWAGSKAVGNMVKGGYAGLANLVSGNPSEAAPAVEAAENNQPQTTMAGKIGAGLGSFFTPNQIAATAAAGPVVEGAAGLIGKGLSTAAAKYGTSGLGKGAETIFNNLPEVEAGVAKFGEGNAFNQPNPAFVDSIISEQAAKVTKAVKSLTVDEAQALVDGLKTQNFAGLKYTRLGTILNGITDAIMERIPNTPPNIATSIMQKALVQGLQDFVESSGSTTLGGIIREALVGGGLSLFGHPGAFMLPFLKEAAKYAPIRNAVISGAEPALSAAGNAVGTATPSLINAGLQAANQ